MKYVVVFNHEPGYDKYAFLSSRLGVKDPQSIGRGWLVELDTEQLLQLILTYPEADIYQSLKKE